jgi:hypothetical protein
MHHFQQEHFEELLKLSQQIVRTNEQVFGWEYQYTPHVLSNLLDSGAFHIQPKEECYLTLRHAMHIFVKQLGETSKEVLLHLGKIVILQLTIQ